MLMTDSHPKESDMLKLHNINARVVQFYADAHASDAFLTEDESCTLSYEDALSVLSPEEGM